MSTRSVPLDCIDNLSQIRDELDVIWCALSNPLHGEECVGSIAEHVNGLKHRPAANIQAMKAEAE